MALTKTAATSSQPPKGMLHRRRSSPKCKCDDPASFDESSSDVPRKKMEKWKMKFKATRCEQSVDSDVVKVVNDEPEDLDENKCLLKKALATWTSPVYKHYHLPPAIKVEEDGTVKYIFQCKCHGTTYTHARKDTSTMNLKNHAEHCDVKANSSKSKKTKIDEVASCYNKGEFCLLHAEWMAQSHCPTIIMEDPKLQEIYRLLNLQVKIHSDTTLAQDVAEVYEMSRECLKELLKEHEG